MLFSLLQIFGEDRRFVKQTQLLCNMPLGAGILKILSKKYPPSSFIERRFQRYDLGLKTDEDGNAILLFMGKKDETGKIRGTRYARRLVRDSNGNIIKDHWDDKGAAG